MTASGFELAFGTNHVGPFLLTSLLLDRLREPALPPGSSPSPPTATTAWTGSTTTPSADPPARARRFTEYCVSKLANVLHAQELGRRLEGTGVTTYSLHPGTVASDVWREVPWPIRPLI